MLFNPYEISSFAQDLKQGSIGLFPFDTLMGITSTITEDNCLRIQTLKQRPNTPFIMILPSISFLDQWAIIPKKSYYLLERYWPGPVTFIFNKHPQVPDFVTSGLSTIAIRICDYIPVTLLLQHLNEPILSTSANFHGEPPATTLENCNIDLLKGVDVVFKQCNAYLNTPSTIIDLSCTLPKIIRQGATHVEFN